jgi:signal transduction histidine kinase
MPARPRSRPHWWPDREPWPPHGGFRQRHAPPARFFRRLALAAGVVVVFAAIGLVALGWLVASGLGVTTTPPTSVVPLLLAAMILISLAVIAAFARSFVSVRNPLKAVMEAADRVAAGDYSARVPEQGPPAIRGLTHAFNTMTVRLNDADRVRRDLMADIAHELRTPLTIMRGRLEGLTDGVYIWGGDQLRVLLEETEVLSRLIDDLRTLALSESGALKLEIEPTDLARLSRDVVTAFASDAGRRGVTLIIDAADSLEPAAVDPVRMREVVSNLLSNAVRHTPSGGLVTLRIARGSKSEVLLEVRDTGSGMTAHELSHAFDRFQKSAGSRGSGLGLTIARNLVVAHRGEIHASSEPGKGTVITVVLPA